MKINKLHIDGQMFYLEPDQDVGELKQQILTSARGVAEFIDFSPVGYGQISVLMSPDTPVRFELEEHSDEELEEWERNPPASDLGPDYDEY